MHWPSLNISEPEYCPKSHPFAFDDGKKCCKYFDRKNTPECDNGQGDLEFGDPETCCPGDQHQPCDNQYEGCVNNPYSDGK